MSAPTVEFIADRNGVVLKNSTIVRSFSVLTGSWTSLRVGVVLGFSSSAGGSITGTPRFVMGICSGSNNVWGDADTGHFVGIRTNDASWNYISSSALTNHYYAPANVSLIRKSGSVSVSGPDATAGVILPVFNWSGSVTKGRMPLFLTLTRASETQMSASIFYPANYGNSTLGVIELDSFLRELPSSAPVFSTVNEGSMNTATTTLEVDESLSGSFDSVNIAWDRESPNPELVIYAIGVAVID